MEQWPHAPIHIVNEKGTYMVTAGTYQRAPVFDSESKLDHLHDTLFEKASEMGWLLQAWAIFPNHYHFIAVSPEHPENIQSLIRIIHGATSKFVNAVDKAQGRKVWFQYWDFRITFEKSYYARLKYVHNNPVHHGMVGNATRYKWCSAAWFEKTAGEAFRKTIAGFKTDRVKVPDDF